MKKIIFLILPVLVWLASCSKSGNTAAAVYTSLEGTWSGTYSNGQGGPANYFSLNFKPSGAVVVHANNVAAPDIANGTWALVGDSVKGSYTYVGSSGIYSFAGRYSSGSNVMAGTVGVGAATTGEAVFSLKKQP